MLRALGAQIERTTNREACRDLSGRRMRDVNAQKQLSCYIMCCFGIMSYQKQDFVKALNHFVWKCVSLIKTASLGERGGWLFLLIIELKRGTVMVAHAHLSPSQVEYLLRCSYGK